MSDRFPVFLAVCAFLATVLASTPATANDPFLLNDYAQQLLRKGEPEKALEQLQQAYSLFPYNETLRRNLAEVYTVVGQQRMAHGRYEDAAASFDGARELYPEVQRYSILRGIALYSARQYDAAVVELERAQGLGGDTPDLLYVLGRAHYDTGNLTDALAAWDQALVLDPGRKDIAAAAEKARRELSVEGGMERGFSSRFMISYDGDERSQLADQVLDILETAYNRVGSDLSHFPVTRVPVLIYTRTDYRKVTKSPDWSGGLYDGKIRLPLGGVTEIHEGLRSLLFHEYTHVVIHELTSGNCPTWLNEGLAELEGRRESSHPLTDLAAAVNRGDLLPLPLLEGSFSSLSSQKALLAYQQSYSFVDYLVQTYGWYKVKDLLVALGSGMSISASFESVFHDLMLDYAGAYQEWLDHVQKEYRR